MKEVRIAGVCERDMDLLFLEEFQSSEAFQHWFMHTALPAQANFGACVSAQRSVKDETGETDLELQFVASDGARIVVLVENKVGSPKQPQQAERYEQRGRQKIVRGDASVYHTVIVAPERYFRATSKGFGGRVTYEQVLSWFQSAPHLGARRDYKLALIRSAIEKGTLGWQVVEDAPNTSFWQSYFELTLVPPFLELNMGKPGAKPSRSGFIRFRPPSLPPGTKLVHKTTQARVDLQFSGMGDRVNELRALFGDQLEKGMDIDRAAASGVIRILTPPLNRQTPFEAQRESALVGLQAALALLHWFQKHRKRWEDRVAAQGPAITATARS
jgi:hypothetical protein